MGTIADLEVVSQIGTMKDRVAVRGDEIDLLDPLFADELLDFLSQIAAVFGIQRRKGFSRLVKGHLEALLPFRIIGFGIGLFDLVLPLPVVLAEHYIYHVQAVQRRTGHQPDGFVFFFCHCFDRFI